MCELILFWFYSEHLLFTFLLAAMLFGVQQWFVFVIIHTAQRWLVLLFQKPVVTWNLEFVQQGLSTLWRLDVVEQRRAFEGCMLPLKDRRSVSSRSHKFCSHSITGNVFLWTRELPRFAGSVLTVYHSVWGPVCSTGRGYVSLGRASLTVSYEPSCELWTEMEPKKKTEFKH